MVQPMRKWLTILFLSLAFAMMVTSCSRSTCPASSNDHDSSSEKSFVLQKDTTITSPAKETGLATMIDSLISVIERLKAQKKDTAVYWIVQKESKDSLSASISVNSAGKVKVNCKEDSLKQVIIKLTSAYTNLYVSKQAKQIVTVAGPTVIKNVIPKWVWVLLAINVVVVGWKITSLFYKPETTGLNILTNLFKK